MSDDERKTIKGNMPKTTIHPMRRQFKDFAFLDIPQEVPSFSTVRELFSRLRTIAADIDDAGLNLFGEGELRLEQLNWIIGRIAAVQQADPAGRVMRYRDHRGHVTDSNASDDPMEMEITILCEAFYYLACERWRSLDGSVSAPNLSASETLATIYWNTWTKTT